MKKIGNFEFPDFGNPADADCPWEPVIRWTAMHRQVMVVARTRVEGKWAAYIAPVPGMNHEVEAIAEPGPLTNGVKVDEKIARLLFSEFDGIPYAK